MNWLTRSYRTLFFNKPISSAYFFNENRLTHSKYFSIFSNKIDQNEQLAFTYKPLKREFSLWPDAKLKLLEYKINFLEFYKNKATYLPIFGGLKYKYHGYLWYKTLEEVDFVEFFHLFDMADTFYSRFKTCELYVWMLLVALPRNNRTWTLTRLGVIEAMWQDNLKRAKVIDVRGKRIRKDMNLLYKKFQMSLLLYDEGFFKSDAMLCSAIWYNFFDKENVDVRYMEALVSFLRFQVNHLRNLDLEALNNNENKTGIWLPVKPHLESVFKSSKALQQKVARSQ